MMSSGSGSSPRSGYAVETPRCAPLPPSHHHHDDHPTTSATTASADGDRTDWRGAMRSDAASPFTLKRQRNRRLSQRKILKRRFLLGATAARSVLLLTTILLIFLLTVPVGSTSSSSSPSTAAARTSSRQFSKTNMLVSSTSEPIRSSRDQPKRRQSLKAAGAGLGLASQAPAEPAILRLRGGGRGSVLWSKLRGKPNMFRRNKKQVLSQPTTTSATATAATASSTSHDREIMVWIRLLFLCYYGSLGALLPYLPVYYDSIGHGGEIIGLLGAVKPATTFIVAPVWGILADAADRPFGILQITFGVSLLGQLAVSYSKNAAYIMMMVFLTALFNAPVKSLLDSMVLEQLADQSSYGRLRLWGQMGFGLGSWGVGILLSRYSHHVPWPEEEQHVFAPWLQTHVVSRLPESLQWVASYAGKCWHTLTGYKLLFFAHAALSVPTWICIQKFRRLSNQQQKLLLLEQQQHDRKSSEKKAAAKSGRSRKKKKSSPSSASSTGSASIRQGLQLLVHNSDALLFFFLVLVVGISSGVIENFAYVRLREVGGTGRAMGLSRLVSSAAGAPMFWYSGPMARALGADRVLVLSLMSYVTRFVIYAAMRHPYHGLPAEALRGVTFAAFWSTSTIYAHAVSPPGLHATMLMFLNAMYGGLGQSLGAIIGGKLQHRFGTVWTFLYSAAFDACFVALLAVYLYVLPPKNGSSEQPQSSFRNPQPIQAPSAANTKGHEREKKKSK